MIRRQDLYEGEQTTNECPKKGYSKPRHKHQGPNPSGRSFSATHATKVTLPTPPLFRLNFAFKTLHMQNVASQRFVSRHEMAVASLDIGDNRPRFKGRPVKGLRPPRTEQSQGEITEMSPSGPARPRSEADRGVSTFSHSILNLELNPQNLH